MPDIGRGGQKSLGKTCGRGLGKDIETIFTLTGKKNCLGYEILDIEKIRVKLKKDNFYDKIVEQIKVFS
jgi:hypothetical protein